MQSAINLGFQKGAHVDGGWNLGFMCICENFKDPLNQKTTAQKLCEIPCIFVDLNDDKEEVSKCSLNLVLKIKCDAYFNFWKGSDSL